MISWPGDSSVLRPVVGEVMDLLTMIRVQNGLLYEAIRIVRRTDDLDVCVTAESRGITGPLEEP